MSCLERGVVFWLINYRQTYHSSHDSLAKKEILELGRNNPCRRVVQYWNRCLKRAVVSPSSEIFKTWMGPRTTWPHCEAGDTLSKCGPKVPSNLNLSMILSAERAVPREKAEGIRHEINICFLFGLQGRIPKSIIAGVSSLCREPCTVSLFSLDFSLMGFISSRKSWELKFYAIFFLLLSEKHSFVLCYLSCLKTLLACF